jgi:hypothetical protein
MRGLYFKLISQFKNGIFPIKKARGSLSFNFLQSAKNASHFLPLNFSSKSHFSS